MKFKTVSNQQWLPEGTHNVTITNAEIGEFTYGDQSLDVTFKNEKGVPHLAKMPTVGYRTFNPEPLVNGKEKSTADHLTAEEKRSGMYAQDVDDKGNVVSNYAMLVAKKDAKGNLVPIDPQRVESTIKTEAARAIIGRLFASCGFEVGEDVEHTELIGKELTITLERQVGNGNYIRLVKTEELSAVEI